MITGPEVLALLKLCAAYDQRTVGKEDVGAWLMVATSQGWNFAAAQRAIVNHYSEDASRGRVNPPAITDALRAVRRASAETFEDPIVPDDLRGVDYPTWYRAQRDAHIERCIEQWAETGVEPRRGSIEGNRAGSLAQLIAQAPDEVREDLAESARTIARKRA